MNYRSTHRQSQKAPLLICVSIEGRADSQHDEECSGDSEGEPYRSGSDQVERTLTSSRSVTEGSRTRKLVDENFRDKGYDDSEHI